MRLNLPDIPTSDNGYAAAKANGALMNFDTISRSLEANYYPPKDQTGVVVEALIVGDRDVVFAHKDWVRHHAENGFLMEALKAVITNGHTQLLHELIEADILTPAAMEKELSAADKKELDIVRARSVLTRMHVIDDYIGHGTIDFILRERVRKGPSGAPYCRADVVLVSPHDPAFLFLQKAGFKEKNPGALSPEMQDVVDLLHRMLEFWHKQHDIYPPSNLHIQNLGAVNLTDVSRIYTLLCRSDYRVKGDEAMLGLHYVETALRLHLLFGTPERVLDYWRRWGKNEQYSLIRCTNVARRSVLDLEFRKTLDIHLWRAVGQPLLQKGPTLLEEPDFWKKVGVDPTKARPSPPGVDGWASFMKP